jgi:hypothetical protein
VMTYTFARVGAVVALNVEDYFAQKKRWWLRLSEKNGKVHEMPCHHKLEAYLDAYIIKASIGSEDKGRCSALRSAKPPSSGWDACHARMSGTWSAAALRTPALKPR